MRERWNGSTHTSRELPCSSAVSINNPIDHKSSREPRSSRNLIQGIKSLKFDMGSSESTLSNTGQPLLVAAALGKSLETLLGPTGTMKMVHTGLSGCESEVVVSSSPTVLLRAMEVLHPCGTLILQALEGMEEAYGSGSTSLIALCGALSAACYNIQEQGVPVNCILDGLRVAEDLCIDVLRDLSFPTKDALREVGALETLHGLSCRRDGLEKTQRDQQQYTLQSGENSRILTGLAAGLQHSIQPKGSVEQGLSLPAALATDVLSALRFENNVFGDENTVVDPATELARVRTRLLVGPDSTSSFVVPRAAIVNIAPGERAAVEEAFVNRCTSCTKLRGVRKSIISQSRATVTICISGVAIVMGDLSATAGASNAAISQIPTTVILRNAHVLLNRSAAGNNNRWAENVSSTLQHFGVDVLLVTGEVCDKLRQLLALKGIVVLSGCRQEEVEATRSASGAAPVQTIEVLTSGDVGRGREFQREERQRGSARDQCGGLSASLLDAGVVSEDRSVFVPELSTRRGPGLGISDTLFLLHDQELDGIDTPNTRSRIDSTNAKPWTGGEENTRRQADIVVMCCGTTLSVCEELRHKFWRVVRRVAGALTEGIVLPGAGASEVACAANLELEAQRLETENAGRLGHPTPMTQLYTPLVLRAMAGALDGVLLLCMANTGGASPDAPQRLSVAKKAAVKHLVRRQRQTVATSSRLLNGSDCTGSNTCPMWSLVPELAVISVASIDDDSSVEGALAGLGDGWDGNSLQGSLDSPPLEGYCQQHRPFVLDNYGSKIGCIERAVGLVSLLAGTDGTLLAPA